MDKRIKDKRQQGGLAPLGPCGLITDFGTKDYFIGVMKGLIKKINPDAEVIDISNDIPSYSLLPASFTLEQAYRFFPAGAIFLVVVDPGVGTQRKILLVEYENRFFIAPDNGVLTPILQEKEKTVFVLDNKDYFLIDGFSTFEARDKMAPAAAYLSRGIDPRQMGSLLSEPEYVLNPDYFPSRLENGIEARIVYIDKFGNIMTNVSEHFLFDALETSGFSKFKTLLNNREIKHFHKTYGQAGAGPFLLIGSHQNLEIAINQGSAAPVLDAKIGQKVVIEFSGKREI
jgi:S-adenosylmethionine hydrolase